MPLFASPKTPRRILRKYKMHLPRSETSRKTIRVTQLGGCDPPKGKQCSEQTCVQGVQVPSPANIQIDDAVYKPNDPA
eukprot:1156732-Pelagomonas_calceolata.AAC.8